LTSPPPTREDVFATVRAQLRKDYPDRAARIDALAPDAALFEQGLLDSLSLLNLVDLLEHTYRFAVPPEDFVPFTFDTLERIAAYLAGRAGRP